jgi:NAD(P)-dependent dehydrogenase (short-subunit alcohol dehydrogenase family)
MPVASRTAADVLAGVELTGTVAVVTGATGGVGGALAAALAGRGARLVLVVRDAARGRQAAQALGAGRPDAVAGVVAVDLADLDAVRARAGEIAAAHPRIGLLVNNAGVMAVPHSPTPAGLERHLATNHLGHAVLTAGLLPALLAAAPARVVDVTSSAGMLGPVRWDDPNFTTGYDKFAAYGQSKSANVLHAAELDRRLADRGVRALAASPGLTATRLGAHLTRDDLKALLARLPRDAKRSARPPRPPAEGAATIAWAALAVPRPGTYAEDCELVDVPAHLADPDAPGRLWELSERLVGAPLAPAAALAS